MMKQDGTNFIFTERQCELLRLITDAIIEQKAKIDIEDYNLTSLEDIARLEKELNITVLQTVPKDYNSIWQDLKVKRYTQG